MAAFPDICSFIFLPHSLPECLAKFLLTVKFHGLAYLYSMKKIIFICCILCLFMLLHHTTLAQCAMCTKTASQLGEKPATGLNQGIVYLMLAPFTIVGLIAYRWWTANRNENQNN